MSHPAKRLESIRELTHELAHVDKLLSRLDTLPPAPRAQLRDLMADLKADGTRRLQYLRQQAAR